MKPTLVNFVQRHAKIIRSFPLVATVTTGILLYKEVEIVLSKKVKSGPLGGGQAIGHMISTGNIRGIIFSEIPYLLTRIIQISRRWAVSVTYAKFPW